MKSPFLIVKLSSFHVFITSTPSQGNGETMVTVTPPRPQDIGNLFCLCPHPTPLPNK